MSDLLRSAVLALTLAIPAAAHAEPPSAVGVSFDAHAGVGNAGSGAVAGPMVGVGLGARVQRVGGGVFAEYIRGTEGRLASFGAAVGPSFSLGDYDLELFGAFGRNHYYDVGAQSVDKGWFSMSGCSSAGASADSNFVGARLGVSRTAKGDTRGLYGLHVFYARDLSVTDHTYTVGCYQADFLLPTTTSSTTHTATLGGHTVGMYLRLGGVAGF